MNKRFLSATLIFFIIISLFVNYSFFVCAAKINYDAEASLSSAHAKAGESVTLTLSLDKSICVKTGSIAVILPEGFSIESGLWKYEGPQKGDDDEDVLNIVTFDESHAIGAFIYGTDTYCIENDILEISVNVPDNCANGVYTVSYELKAFDSKEASISIKQNPATIGVYDTADSMHIYSNDYDTDCEICGYVREAIGGNYGENCSWAYKAADKVLTISGSSIETVAGVNTPWKSLAKKLSKIVIDKSVLTVSDNVFEGVNADTPIYIMGNPDMESGVLPTANPVFGWSGAKTEAYCLANGITFNELEEFDVCGYQVGAKSKNMFRVAAQMRYADYYNAAGFYVTAVDSDGSNKKIDKQINTVYKTLTGTLVDGTVGEVAKADDGCHLSAVSFTGLPEMADDEKIIISVTPYVVNIYSGEKFYLEKVQFKYSSNGIELYTPLTTSEGAGAGTEIIWENW